MQTCSVARQALPSAVLASRFEAFSPSTHSVTMTYLVVISWYTFFRVRGRKYLLFIVCSFYVSVFGIFARCNTRHLMERRHHTRGVDDGLCHATDGRLEARADAVTVGNAKLITGMFVSLLGCKHLVEGLPSNDHLSQAIWRGTNPRDRTRSPLLSLHVFRTTQDRCSAPGARLARKEWALNCGRASATLSLASHLPPPPPLEAVFLPPPQTCPLVSLPTNHCTVYYTHACWTHPRHFDRAAEGLMGGHFLSKSIRVISFQGVVHLLHEADGPAVDQAFHRTGTVAEYGDGSENDKGEQEDEFLGE